MLPDILGYKLDDAISVLNDLGCEVIISTTNPPRGIPEGPKRVVSLVSEGSGKVVLTVVCEDKGKGGVHSGL